MKRFTASFPSAWLALLILCLAVNASAMQMRVEGRANISLMLVNDPLIICSTSVSGEEQDKLLAINIRERMVKWLKGNTTISRMEMDHLPHELRIAIVDPENDQLRWEHVEPVVIKRIAE